MNQLPALLKREFQEHRGTVLYVPVAVTTIILLLLLLALTVISAGDEGWVRITLGDDESAREVIIGPWYQQSLEKLIAMDEAGQQRILEAAYFAVGWPLLAILWFLIFFYLLGTLYDDRRDRSVLFWKSMPVSDGTTVASKLITALLVIPAIYFGFLLVAQVGLLITSTLSVSNAPDEFRSAILRPGVMIGTWLQVFGFHLLTIVWCLPFFAWTLLVSAWAKSVPFVWVAAVPLTLAAIDRIFVTGELGGFMLRHSMPVGYRDEMDLTVGETFLSFMTSWELPVALAVAGAFIYLAVWMRGRADEI